MHKVDKYFTVHSAELNNPVIPGHFDPFDLDVVCSHFFTWFNLNQSQSGASSAKSHSNNTIYLRAGSCFRRYILKGLLRFFGDMDHISPKIVFNTFLDAKNPKSIQYYSVLMIILRKDVKAGSPRSVTSRIICRPFPANPWGTVRRQLG